MKYVIAGGSGALGRRLAADLLSMRHEVVVLTRKKSEIRARQVLWDGRTRGPWEDELDCDVLVNLAGQIVDCRPTSANIDLLLRSRVEPTLALKEAIRANRGRVPLWIQASTTAIYGDAKEASVDEYSTPAAGPPQMAGVARAWEQSAENAPADRQVVLRTSIVLDRNTPAFDRLASVARCGLGGPIAGGRQWFSWIHVRDWLNIVEWVTRGGGSHLDGVLLATAPTPVRNAELMALLRGALGRHVGLPTPAWLLRLGSVLLRTDPALALTGRHAVSSRLEASDFRFTFPTLGLALSDLVMRPTR